MHDFSWPSFAATQSWCKDIYNLHGRTINEKTTAVRTRQVPSHNNLKFSKITHCYKWCLLKTAMPVYLETHTTAAATCSLHHSASPCPTMHNNSQKNYILSRQHKLISSATVINMKCSWLARILYCLHTHIKQRQWSKICTRTYHTSDHW